MEKKVLDFHTHIGKDKDGLEQSIEQLIRSMGESRVTHSVIFPFDEREETLEKASLKLCQEAKGYPFYTFFRFDPKDMTPERLKEQLNRFYGVKLHPRSQNFDPLEERFFPLYEIISASEKPLLFHTRYEDDFNNQDQINPNTNPSRIVKLAEKFPNLNLVMGHFGNRSLNVFQAMQRYPKVYLETSIFGSTPKTIEQAAQIVGANRLLFGSDVPYSDQFIERMKIDRSKLKPVDKERILYYNAARLLKIS